MKKIKYILLAIIAAGIVMLAVGIYYSVIVAGLPYQDPTPEMLEKWNMAHRTGTLWQCIGAATALIGAVGLTAIKILSRRFKNKSV